MGHALRSLAVVLAAAACAVAPRGGGEPPIDEHADAVRHIAFLASDLLAGRQTPSVGLDLAAGYVQQEFSKAGVLPGNGGGYVQYFPFPLVAADPDRAALTIDGRPLRYASDFTVLPGGPGAVTGTPTFLGTASPKVDSARDQRRIDGIAVMLLAGYPSDPSRWLANREASTLARRGAAGVIFLVDSLLPPSVMRNAAARAAQPARQREYAPSGIPVAFLRASAAQGAVLRRAPVTLAAPRRVFSPDSAPNVIGLIPGRDPRLRDEYVVVTAHMDHVGIGAFAGDNIFNGADDNASGTTALLLAARRLAALPASARPARSVLFVAVSGEEHGLLGSDWFAAHPPIPFDRIVANVNLDMVGRNARDTITAIGLEYSSLAAVIRSVATTELTLVPDATPAERSFQRSDQFSFARRGVPAIMLSSGTHVDYHAVSDEASRLDAEKVRRVARLASDLTRRIADDRRRPELTEAGRALVERR